jgi:hypothetical protein
MALAGGAVKNCNTSAAIWLANVCLPNTLDCVSTDGNGLWVRGDGYTGQVYSVSASGYNPTTVTMNDTAYYPELGTYGLWEVVCLTPAQPPATCFTGETRVLMADGVERRIDEIDVGDLVLSPRGQVSRVIGVEQPPLGNRLLYAFNGERPFVTAEHPVMTEEGWKSVNPKATEAENAALVLSRLQVGDVLMTVARVAEPAVAAGYAGEPFPEVVLEPARLAAMVAKSADPDMTLYNLVLDEGHSYFANGYLVHNKGGGTY